MTRPFHITLSPVRSDSLLHLDRQGAVLVVNGQPIDCTGLAEGDRITAAETGCAALLSDILATADALRLTLLLPHGAMAPEAARFPGPLVLAADGPVRLPTDPAPL